MPSVLQDWVQNLPLMQQTVLLTILRGPDGVHKDHPVKNLCRWIRRCILVSAMSGEVLNDPYERGGGSFMGPVRQINPRGEEVDIAYSVEQFFRAVDELPHHFSLHLLHASEIIGLKHPNPEHAAWWTKFYLDMVKDMHLRPELPEDMNRRLGDTEAGWKAAQVTTE